MTIQSILHVKVLNSFSLELGAKYGFRFETDNELWFEEAPQLPPKHILNGAIYSIWGIYDLMLISDNPGLKVQWQKSVNTIRYKIHRYDAGFWSYYDLTGNLASYYYHNKVHICQLGVLYEQTSEELFKNYTKKWLNYNASLRYRTLKKLMSVYRFLSRKRHNYNKKISKSYQI